MKRDQIKLTPLDSSQQWAAFFIEQKFYTMWLFRTKIVNNPDSEVIHDMRVASRRLRSVLTDFRGAIPKKTYRTLIRLTKTLTQILGILRDADILIENLHSIPEQNDPETRTAVQNLKNLLHQQKQDGLAHLKMFLAELDRNRFEPTYQQLIRDLRNG